MRTVLAGLLVALSLTGCSDDGADVSDGAQRPSFASASPSPTPGLAERLLGGGAEDAGPLATAEGALQLLGGSSPVRVEVLEVRAGGDSTVLRWRLASATDEQVRTYTSALSFPLGFDTRQVALLSADERLQPFTFVPQQDIGGGDAGCVCSQLPESVGPEGVTLSALYPPLADGTEQVDVVLPGVATLAGVPVER